MAFWNRKINSPTSSATQEEKPKPKGWVRWSGFGMVVGVIGLFLLVGYLGITWSLKSQLEKGLSSAWGAKVEIGAIDLGLFPVEVGFRDLQITDPKKPMENLIEIHRISAALNLYHWVIGRTVIENVFLTDMAMHQPRQSSGALPKKPTPVVSKANVAPATASNKANDLAIPLPKMALPTSDELLSRETLQTVTLAKEIEQKLAEISQAWSNLEAEMPSQQQINAYQDQFKTLTQGKVDSVQAFEAKKAEFETLKQSLETKQQALNRAQKTLKNHLPELQQQIKDLKKSPQQDYQRILATYSLDASGLTNISYLLFGSQVQAWTQEGIKWFGKAEPVIAYLKNWMAEKAQQEAQAAAAEPKRFVGQEIHFKEKDPQPDFIIKRIQLEGDLNWGRLKAEVTQVTFDHPKTQLPTLFKVIAQPNQAETPLSFVGQSNFVNPNAPFTEAKVHWPQRKVEDWKILKDRNLPLTLQQAVVDVDGLIVLTPKHQINAWLQLDYQQVDMQIVESASKDVNRYIAPLFKDIHAFKVHSKVTGDWYAPKVGANSDLDKILSGAFDKLLKQELAKLKADLQAQLDAELQKHLDPIRQQLETWMGKESQLALQQKGILQILDSNWQANAKQALQQRLDEEVKKAQQQAQAKIEAEKAKLEQAKKAAEAKLAAQKKAAEEKAKAELAAQKKAAEEKAKQDAEKAMGDQVKKLFKF